MTMSVRRFQSALAAGLLAVAVLAAPGARSQVAPPTPGLRPGPAILPSMPSPPAPATDPDAAYTAFDQGRYLTALALASKAAEAGDPQAHTLIGRIHAEGLGVKRDETVASQWYHRAAQLGDIEGAFALGVLLAE